MTDRKPGSVDTLAKLTGISHEDMLATWDQVKANGAKLNACPRHDFEQIPDGKPMRHRFRCTHCTGEVDSSAYYWHEQGRRQDNKDEKA